jgi:hypothetical protein
MKKKVRIVTADFGNHIEGFNPKLPHQLTKNFEVSFSVYNDKNTPSRSLSLHPRLKGKIPKMLEWMEFDADYYFWVDSKFKITSNNFVEEVIHNLGDADFGLMKHPSRKSILSELEYMEHAMSEEKEEYLINRYTGENMRNQVESYIKTDGFVDDKLFAMGFFVYTKKVIENKEWNIMKDWFFQNTYWSIQDQLSFPFLLSKHNINYKVFDFHLFSNPYIKWG